MTRSMLDLRLSFKLEQQGVVGALETLLREDKDNLSAKNKLRFSSVVEALCPGGAGAVGGLSPAWQLAVLQQTGKFIEAVLYAVLGRAGVQERATLRTLLDPRTSPVLLAQQGWLKLLLNFHEDNVDWGLLLALGADFGNAGLRTFTRQTAISYGSGVFQHFERLWSLDLYLLAIASMGSCPQPHRIRLALSFFSKDVRCYPQAGQRLREMFSTPADLLKQAEVLFLPFLEQTPVSNDKAERLNSRLRQYTAHSTGKAANFTEASNRAMARDMLEHHVAAGGVDPTSRQGLRLGPLGTLVEKVLGPTETGKTGGNVWREFHNRRLEALSEVGRAVLKDSQHNEAGIDADVANAWSPETLERRIRAEWDDLKFDKDEYEAWRSLYRAKRRRKEMASIEDAKEAEVDAETPWQGVFGSSTRRCCVLAPEDMAITTAAMATMEWEQKRALWTNDPTLEVRGLVPTQIPKEPTALRRLLQGCGAEWRNICRKHALNPVQVRQLNTITTLLTQYVHSLPKERVWSAEEIVCFIGRNSSEDKLPIYSVVLIADGRFSPCVQVLCPVAWPHGDKPCDSNAWTWPQKAEIESGAPRMECLDCNELLSIRFRTSDEVGWQLIRTKSQWRLYPVEYCWHDGPNLLRLQLNGLKPCFEPRQVTKTDRSTLVKEACENLDPWADGEAAASGHVPGLPLQPVEDPSEDDSVLSGLRGPIEAEDVDVGGIGSDYKGSVSDPGSDGLYEVFGPDDEGDADVEALQAVHGIADAPEPEGGGTGDPPEEEPPPMELDRPPPLPPPALEPPPIVREPPDYPRAGRNENQRMIQGRTVTILRNRGAFSGYSVVCPTCNVAKDLNWVNSGMSEREALFRLWTWMDHCRPNHRAWGGRLLKDCELS